MVNRIFFNDFEIRLWTCFNLNGSTVSKFMINEYLHDNSMILYILHRFDNLCHLCDIIVTFLLPETTYVHCKLLYFPISTIIIVVIKSYIIGHWRFKMITCSSTPNSARSFIQKHKPCVDLLLYTKCHMIVTISCVCMHNAHVCYMRNYHVLCNSKFICLVLHVLQLMERSHQHMLHDASYFRLKSIQLVYLYSFIKLVYMIIISFVNIIFNFLRFSCTIRVFQCYSLFLMYNIIHHFFIIILFYLYSVCTHVFCHIQPTQLYSLIPCTKMYPHCQSVGTLLTFLNITIIVIYIHVHTHELVDSLQTYKYNGEFNEHSENGQSLNKIYHIKAVSAACVQYMSLNPALFHNHYCTFINDIYLSMRSYAKVKWLKIVIMLFLNKSNSIVFNYFPMFVFTFNEFSNCHVSWLYKIRVMKSNRGYNVDFVMHFLKLHTFYAIYYMTLVLFLIEMKLFLIVFNFYNRYSVYIIVYEALHNG